jgi:hypothetical protein
MCCTIYRETTFIYHIAQQKNKTKIAQQHAAAAALYIYIAALQCDDDDMLARPRGFTPRT